MRLNLFQCCQDGRVINFIDHAGEDRCQLSTGVACLTDGFSDMATVQTL
ncbi:MAG: hypothetical protein P8179_24635 [Candidatus Thiodiazotropha sp.]